MAGYLKVALCAAVFACAGQAEAAKLTFSDRGVAVNLPKFDTDMGILESVSVSHLYVNQFAINHSEQSGPPPSVRILGKIGQAGLGIYGVDQFFASQQQGSFIAVATVRKLVEEVFVDNLSFYSGKGSLYFAPLENVRVFGSRAGINTPTPFSDFSITYTYAAYAPEPTTWALMLVGFGMTGYALRRRRARVVFA